MRSQKKTFIALALSLFMLVGGYRAAWAQDADSKATQPEGRMSMSGMMKNCPMMGGGMMQGDQMQGGMMGMMMRRIADDPIKRSVMQVYMLPSLRDALNLADDQAARLEDAKQHFTERRAEIQERLKANQEQLQEALSADQPDLEQARTLLSDRAALEADRQMAALRAAVQMKAALSEAQRETLASLKPMQMHQAMMRDMSMMNMMQMMGDMQMQCPMMGGGMPMMQGGMQNMDSPK